MNNNNNYTNTKSNGDSIGFLSLLGLLFIGLKLTGFIDWSWWWVLLPFYGGFILWLIVVVSLFWYVNKKR